jgi:SAM-dependent MidA family methyltransferase
MNSSKRIQPFVSRFDTVRVRLSVEAYQEGGVGIFHAEKIPFADRTGPAFAQKVVLLLITRLQVLPSSDQLHIYELGTGNGVLAKRILDLLEEKHPQFYKRITLHATDFSPSSISELATSVHFKKHTGHISFEVLDATDPVFEHKPIFVYCTNLIDSLPSKDIKVKNGQAFEVVTQTSLTKDAQVIDTSVFPPRVLEAEEIGELLKSDDSSRRFELAPRLAAVLEEKTKLVPIVDPKLTAFIEEENIKKGQFNYSPLAVTALKKILEQLDDGGLVLISDFGVDTAESVSYKLEFGLILAFSVFVPLIKHAVETAGERCLIGPHEQGGQLEILIDSKSKDADLDQAFLKNFGNDVQAEVAQFLNNIKEKLAEQEVSAGAASSLASELVELYDSLTPAAQVDYLLLNDFSQLLVRHKLYELTFRFTDILLKTYQQAVGMYYYLIRGQAFQEIGQLAQAEACFQEACRYRAALPFAYLGNLYFQQNKMSHYIQTVKEYLKYSRKPDTLKSLFFISLAYEKIERMTEAQEVLRAIVQLGLELKELPQSERAVLDQATRQLALLASAPKFAYHG